MVQAYRASLVQLVQAGFAPVIVQLSLGLHHDPVSFKDAAMRRAPLDDNQSMFEVCVMCDSRHVLPLLADYWLGSRPVFLIDSVATQSNTSNRRFGLDCFT